MLAFTCRSTGKKIKGRKGRKRHISVDTQGNLLGLEVHAADLQDRDKAKDIFADTIDTFPTVSHFFADGGYAGDKVFCDLLNMEPSPTIEIIRRPNNATGFVVIARRWVVERTFAWLGRLQTAGKGLAKDWEKTISSSESWLLIAAIRRASTHLKDDKSKAGILNQALRDTGLLLRARRGTTKSASHHVQQ